MMVSNENTAQNLVVVVLYKS